MNSTLLAALIASGATTPALPSAWREAIIASGATDGQLSTFLKAQGLSGSTADMFSQYLADKGYVGTLSDKLAAASAQDDLFYTGYSLSDDGTNAALFGHDPLLLTDGIYGTYTFTGEAKTLVALPRSISEAPGVVPLVEGETRVCAFSITDIVPGVIPDTSFSLYNPSDSVLFNALVESDDGATTGRIKLEYGTYPGSMTTADTCYEGELVGVGFALALTYAAGQVTCTLYVTDPVYWITTSGPGGETGGCPVATSPAITTSGGVFADILVTDEVGASGAISLEINPSVYNINANLPTSSVDMDGVALAPSGYFNPLSLAGTLELWHWQDKSKLWTTDARTTNVAAVADPVGSWSGYLNRSTMHLSTGTASNRPEYSSSGILVNSVSTYKELSFARAVANNTPLTMLMRFTNTSGQHPRFAGYVGSTASTGTTAGTTIFGRARTGTPLNSGVSAVGDHCVVVSFDGTNAYLKIDGGAAQTITVGADATARDTIKLASLLAAAGVNTVKYLQVVEGAVSEADAAKWITWASVQP